MKLIVGLGNPGPEYARTRHNVGFRVVARFASDHRIDLDREAYRGVFGRGHAQAHDATPVTVGVLQPHTFMNLSGDAVSEAAQELAIETPDQILVVSDDVDLPFGRIRLRSGGGPGGQRGLAHIIERLGTRAFPRLRFGIGRPPTDLATATHVLEEFSPAEESELGSHIARASEAVTHAVCHDLPSAMNRFNRDAPEASTKSTTPKNP